MTGHRMVCIRLGMHFVYGDCFEVMGMILAGDDDGIDALEEFLFL